MHAKKKNNAPRSLLDRLYDTVDDIQSLIFEKKTQEIETKYNAFCQSLAGQEITDRIAAVDLSSFRKQVDLTLKERIFGIISQKRDSDTPIKAVYFEYDPNNDWECFFFLCTNYLRAIENDDDWACDWITEIECPNIAGFAELEFNKDPFDSEFCLGKLAYAQARLMLNFAEVCFQFTSQVPICIAFHDQSGITRIFSDEE